ncbi:hypothetical protein LSAT2_017474, partial [Lamellibrachia satsuma]
MLVNHIKSAHFKQGSGRGPTRLIRLVSRVPPTTDGTRLKTAWSLTGALLEILAATATDDGDSVGVTSADDVDSVGATSANDGDSVGATSADD